VRKSIGWTELEWVTHTYTHTHTHVYAYINIYTYTYVYIYINIGEEEHWLDTIGIECLTHTHTHVYIYQKCAYIHVCIHLNR